ncbi:ATP-binding protein [Streptomyces echinatus]|uniref:Biotin-dependent 3-methylcrotonyl-coenzyme A carboxylase alpha1 subunit n=1 Tax=Streptomyces echinatus TaxID=67293 RepID=A0A7W9PY46_9ACTN|nr:biotin carboxylase N-terminal domain-containing protein [Streptomyces echinatus]MBB5930131.1 propionyl-CoA carboxylase alpha chain/3-methylcrotonyl-CoA carboxylase alpha subunit [Streptomyces echinatus]
MVKRLLIANRGEIARRIARTCRRLGIEYVAVHSEADGAADHLEGAFEQVLLGPSPAADSYLRVDGLVDAALRTGCDAVHPGYGFLSENPEFAAAVAEAGLVFVGPGADTIAAMGDKATAKRLMAAAGVPVLPGSADATESADEIRAHAARIGYPVILKPVAGGGGKGMRVIEREDDLAPAVEAAVRLARANFGDGRLLVERYLRRPRHIEVQVFGDTHGTVLHLFERECSLQRRHQKIVEEAPAVNLPAKVREALLEAAVRGARAIGYVNAGTFEFILDGNGEFFFLEVNTRLQVEHPVTEAITGLDLVEWQLRVAAGEELPLSQEEITASGHAVEVRVYAEDPDADFRPAPGRVLDARWPTGLRVDAAFDTSGDVPVFYDPMIAKLVAHGPGRPAALTRLRHAIRDTAVLGLTTNLGFLADLLGDTRVAAGLIDTHLVDEFTARAAERPRDLEPVAAACAAAMALPARPAGTTAESPWSGSLGALDRELLDPEAPLGRVACRVGSRPLEAALLSRRAGALTVAVAGERYGVTCAPDGALVRGTAGEARWAGLRRGDGCELVVDGRRLTLTLAVAGEDDSTAGTDAVTSPMPGTVVQLPVSVGDSVRQGDTVAIVEAMKMENRVLAPAAGVVEEIRCSLSEIVSADQILVVIGAADPEEPA